MKCPKCQYISFDNGQRCRNCGYEFSLAQLDETANDDLSIHRDDEPLGPLGDFSLNETPNLPLFEGRDDPDAPLVSAPAHPRAPLAVRRAAPAAPRPRARRDTSEPEPRLALDTADLTGTYPAGASEPHAVAAPTDVDVAESPGEIASRSARLGGGLIDLLLLGSIDAGVIYLTLRICDLTFGEISSLPLAPLISFLVLLNGGYLSTFVAASGQTMGKMAVGTRVVPANPPMPTQDRVSFGQAVVRAAGYLVSAMPFGLGFVPVFVSSDRRALHDRLADTRVVKA